MTAYDALALLEHRWLQIKQRVGTKAWPEFVANYQAAVSVIPPTPNPADLEKLVESIRQLIITVPAIQELWWDWENTLVGTVRGLAGFEEVSNADSDTIENFEVQLINRYQYMGEIFEQSIADGLSQNRDNPSVPLNSSSLSNGQ